MAFFSFFNCKILSFIYKQINNSTNKSTSHDQSVLVEHQRLSRRDTPHRLGEGKFRRVSFDADRGFGGGAPIADASFHHRVLQQPFGVGECAGGRFHRGGQQVVAVTEGDGVVCGIDAGDVLGLKNNLEELKCIKFPL